LRYQVPLLTGKLLHKTRVMAAIQTSQTAFSANEQITSAKLNNILLNSSFAAGALTTDNTLTLVSGQMQVNVLKTANFPEGVINQTMIGTNVVGKGPIFLAAKVVTQSLTGNNQIINDLSNEVYDTNNSYAPATSTFTVPISGYYLLMGLVTTNTVAQNLIAQIFVNGIDTIGGEQVSATTLRAAVSGVRLLVVGDLVQLRASVTGTVSINSATFEGCLIRSA
jgi:hypothetical protein